MAIASKLYICGWHLRLDCKKSTKLIGYKSRAKAEFQNSFVQIGSWLQRISSRQASGETRSAPENPPDCPEVCSAPDTARRRTETEFLSNIEISKSGHFYGREIDKLNFIKQTNDLGNKEYAA